MEDKIQPLQEQAAKIRESSLLGRQGSLHRLFDYLVECSSKGHTPREIEIAIDVFNRSGDFDPSQDATTRVYIHKLRTKLHAFYQGPGRHEPVRLYLPKGEYRLAVKPATLASDGSDHDEAATTPGQAHHRLLPWALVLSIAVNGILLFAWWTTSNRMAVSPTASPLQRTQVWSGLFEDNRPILLVLGDYYIFGDTGESAIPSPTANDVSRLVRDFEVNSTEDLRTRLAQQPQLAGRYVDLDLSYLPISSAFALRRLVPVLLKPGQELQVTMASDLRVDMIKNTHVVYVGLFSGMGVLQDFAFTGSHYSIGRNYDELIDTATSQRYHSQFGAAIEDKAVYSDYGYVTGFTGPSGNRIMIISGTRDVAVMHAAEALSNPEHVQELASALAGDGADFDALYEVSGVNHTNISGQLLKVSPRKIVVTIQEPPVAFRDTKPASPGT